MFDLSLTSNASTIDQALAALQASVADVSPALQQIADDFRELISEQFASEGRAGGTPWTELAPSTLRRKRRAGSSILYVTGALLRSLRDPGEPGHAEEFDGNTLTIGSRLPYALYHQTGVGWGFNRAEAAPGPQKGRGLPMRPLIVVSGERSERWVEIVRQHMEGETALLGSKELG